MPKIQAATPIVKVTSAYNIIEPEMTFLINITITDVTDLYMWSINLTWDPNIIKITTGDPNGLEWPRGSGSRWNIYEGPFLKKERVTIFMVKGIDQTRGKIKGLTCSYKSEGATLSGSGLLAMINFTSVNVGTTAIDIDGASVTYPRQSALLNSEMKEILHEDKDGTVTENDPPIPPIWSELWFQGTIVGIAVVAVVATAFRYRKKIAQHLPKHEEEAEELLEEDLRFQKLRI